MQAALAKRLHLPFPRTRGFRLRIGKALRAGESWRAMDVPRTMTEIADMLVSIPVTYSFTGRPRAEVLWRTMIMGQEPCFSPHVVYDLPGHETTDAFGLGVV